MNRSELLRFHKSRPNFGKRTNREEIAKTHRAERHDRRTTIFNARRNMSAEEDYTVKKEAEEVPKKTTVEVDPLLSRKLALQKYKLQKEEIKKAQQKNKKPPFVVGIPHHGSSPVLKELTNKPDVLKHKQMKEEVRNQRITRATTRMGCGNVVKAHVFVKPNNDQRIRKPNVSSPVRAFPFKQKKSVFTFKGLSEKKLTSPHTPTVLKRSAQKRPEQKTIVGSYRPRCTEVKKQIPLVPSPLAAPLPVPSTVEDKVREVEPARVPFISDLFGNDGSVLESSGASSNSSPKNYISRRTRRMNTRQSLIKTTESPNQNNILDEEEKPNLSAVIKEPTPTPGNAEAVFHRDRVNEETRRLLALAEKWEKIALQENIPQDVVDEIDSVVGQTRLLTRDKFKQFRGLVDQFESKISTHPVTSEDLIGFWEMMFLQVETLDKKYQNLDVLESNGWKQLTPPTKKRKTIKKKTTSTISSTIPKKTTKETTPGPSSQYVSDLPKCAGTVTPVLTTDNQRRLRSNSPAPFIAMRLSGVGRNSAQFLSVNEEQGSPSTPMGILKKKIKSEIKKSTRKTIIFSQTTSCVELIEQENLACSISGNNLSQRSFNEEISFSEAPDYTKTPRRSTRLLGRSPTPMKRVCSTCTSSSCTPEECPSKSSSKRARSSRLKDTKVSPR